MERNINGTITADGLIAPEGEKIPLEKARKMFPFVEECIKQGNLFDSVVASSLRGSPLSQQEKEELVRNFVAHGKTLAMEGEVIKDGARAAWQFLNALKWNPRKN